MNLRAKIEVVLIAGGGKEEKHGDVDVLGDSSAYLFKGLHG